MKKTFLMKIFTVTALTAAAFLAMTHDAEARVRFRLFRWGRCAGGQCAPAAPVAPASDPVKPVAGSEPVSPAAK